MPNERIKKQIVDQLYWDSRVDASDVEVHVDNGRVRLEGMVPSFRAKSAAVQDSYLVEGVKYVDDNLEIKPPLSQTDADIKRGTQNVLRWTPDIDESKIAVDVLDGWSTLRGTVDAYWKKREAEAQVFQVDGVKGVRNELGIVLSGKVEDERIAKDIEAALERNSNVEVDDIDVEVMNGRVTLSGKVPNWTARQAAYDSACFTSGVEQISNQVAIR